MIRNNVDLRSSIIDDRHKETETKFLDWLLANVPEAYENCDELQAQVRYYAFEAADIFDPTSGQTFELSLDDHLQRRCEAFSRYLWRYASADDKPRSGQFAVKSVKHLIDTMSPEAQRYLNEMLSHDAKESLIGVAN